MIGGSEGKVLIIHILKGGDYMFGIYYLGMMRGRSLKGKKWPSVVPFPFLFFVFGTFEFLKV
jgi:hypothetical protein